VFSFEKDEGDEVADDRDRGGGPGGKKFKRSCRPMVGNSPCRNGVAGGGLSGMRFSSGTITFPGPIKGSHFQPKLPEVPRNEITNQGATR
jgi:hypothetical protein